MIQLNIGDSVIYVDEHGQEHCALVTVLHEGFAQSYGGEVGCNLVYVSGDAEKSDPYGRQIDRATSVVHQSGQPAHGRFWRLPTQG
jgi:hypothetical protein